VVANILVTQAAGDPDGDTKFQLNDESSSHGSRGHRSHCLNKASMFRFILFLVSDLDRQFFNP